MAYGRKKAKARTGGYSRGYTSRARSTRRKPAPRRAAPRRQSAPRVQTMRIEIVQSPAPAIGADAVAAAMPQRVVAGPKKARL